MEHQKPTLLSSNTLPLAKGVKIVAQHPAGLIAFEKPPGIRSHPNGEKPDHRALLYSRYNFQEECFHWHTTNGDEQKLFLLNRLDAPTSGLLLGALSLETANTVRAQFVARKVYKCYYALIKGQPLQQKQVWKDHLQITKERGQLRVRCDNKKGVTALATMSFIQPFQVKGKICSLIKLEPTTGRPHQLRVQCARREWPIVGDDTYGDFRFNRIVRKATGFQWLFLHSAEIALKFTYQEKQDRFCIRSALPQWFLDLEYLSNG